MKPFRGKRRGPQSPPVGFNPSQACRARRRIRKGRGAHARTGNGCTSGGRSATTGSSAARSPRGRWPHLRVRCYRPGRRSPVGGPRKTYDRGRPRYRGPARAFDWRGLSPVPADRGRAASSGPADGLGSVANRSVTCPTRLETRTKESNMCASQWVLRNLEAQ